MKRKTAGIMYEAAAGAMLSIGVVQGFLAHDSNTNARNAQQTERTYIAQGDVERADTWSTISNNDKHDRNLDIGLAAIEFGVAALYVALGDVALKKTSREDMN